MQHLRCKRTPVHLFSKSFVFTNSTNFPLTSRIKIDTDKLTGITHVMLNLPQKNRLDVKILKDIKILATILKKDKNIRTIILSGGGHAPKTSSDTKSILKVKSPMKNKETVLNSSSGYNSIDGSIIEKKSKHNLSSSSISLPESRLFQKYKSLETFGQDISFLFRDIPVPIIAVLNDICFGFEFQLSLSADLRFCKPYSKLLIMEENLGLISDLTASVTLRELVRIDTAKELAMTRRILTGKEAESIGLVTKVNDNPLEEAENMAKNMIEKSPDSIAMTKLLFQDTWVVSDQRCLNMETMLQKKQLGSWNQLVASGKIFGVKWLPYCKRKNY